MTDPIQLPGGNRTSQDLYTGAARELTVDESSQDLRLHDGYTKGGHAILSRNNADDRYQPRSVELSGFAGFAPETVGFVVRVNPGAYVFRILEVAEGQLTLNDGDGYAGNPSLGLPDDITKDLTFSGDIEFTGGVEATTFTGDLTGNVTGNLEGDVTGDVTGNVTGNLTGDTEGVHTGDVDIRGAELQLDVGQIPNNAVFGLVDLIKANGVPNGVIMLWTGLESTIPAGWFLCNGLNGTPDLRDRFVVGAGTGGDAAPGDYGGLLSRTVDVSTGAAGAHEHTVTGAALSASSGVTIHTTEDTVDNGSTAEGILDSASLTDPGHAHTVTGSTSEAATHTHTVSVTIESLPPYFALCYIMKG